MTLLLREEREEVGQLWASMGMNDVETIVASVSDPTIFSELFDRHAPSLYRYLARRAGPELAEDLLSETFLVAFENRDRFEPDRGEPRGWLYGIAANQLRRHARDQSRHLQALLRVAANASGDAETDPTERVISKLDAQMAVDSLVPQLEAMPETDREVLLLRAWSDLSYSEIAAAVGIPAGTVASRINRARSLFSQPFSPSYLKNGA